MAFSVAFLNCSFQMAYNFNGPFPFPWSGYGPNTYNPQSAGPRPPPPPGFSPDVMYGAGRFAGVYPFGVPYPNQSEHYGGTNWNYHYPHVQPQCASNSQINTPNTVPIIPPAPTSAPATVTQSNISGLVKTSLSAVGIPGDTGSGNINNYSIAQSSTASSMDLSKQVQPETKNLADNLETELVNKVTTLLSDFKVLESALYSQIQQSETKSSPALNNECQIQVAPICLETQNVDQSSKLEQILAATLKVASQNYSAPNADLTPSKIDNPGSVRFVVFPFSRLAIKSIFKTGFL